NPATRTPAFHDDGAGNFQNDVAQGEDARSEANYAIVEAEIVRHLQGRSGKVVAVKVSNDVQQEHIRQKTQSGPTASPAGDVINANGWGRQFSAEDGLVGSEHAAQKNHAIIYRAPNGGVFKSLSSRHRFLPRRDAC